MRGVNRNHLAGEQPIEQRADAGEMLLKQTRQTYDGRAALYKWRQELRSRRLLPNDVNDDIACRQIFELSEPFLFIVGHWRPRWRDAPVLVDCGESGYYASG
jgi:hypothetical protein